jgi:hypothetical protein
MLKWTKTKKISQIGFAQSELSTENPIFMACLDAHLYEIEYKYCQHASKSRLQRAYERWAPTLLATNGLVKRDVVMATQLDAAFH